MKRTTCNKLTIDTPFFSGKWLPLLGFLLTCLPAFSQNSVAYLNTAPIRENVYPISTHPEHIIPFELVRGMIILPARVDRQVGHFILDTGAPLIIINDEPEQTSRLACSFKEEIRVGETTIGAFQWAGSEEKDLEALVLDISHLESTFDRPLMGLIGFNAFKNDELFFDYGRQVLLRYPAFKNILHQNARPRYSIPFRLYDHLAVITLRIGKKKYTFGLDSGACINMIDRSVLRELEAETVTHLPDEEVQGLDKSVTRVNAVDIHELKVKGIEIDELKFLATDMPQLRSVNGLKLDGLLGYTFLSRMKFSINYPKRRIYVWE